MANSIDYMSIQSSPNSSSFDGQKYMYLLCDGDSDVDFQMEEDEAEFIKRVDDDLLVLRNRQLEILRERQHIRRLEEEKRRLERKYRQRARMAKQQLIGGNQTRQMNEIPTGRSYLYKVADAGSSIQDRQDTPTRSVQEDVDIGYMPLMKRVKEEVDELMSDRRQEVSLTNDNDPLSCEEQLVPIYRLPPFKSLSVAPINKVQFVGRLIKDLTYSDIHEKTYLHKNPIYSFSSAEEDSYYGFLCRNYPHVSKDIIEYLAPRVQYFNLFIFLEIIEMNCGELLDNILEPPFKTLRNKRIPLLEWRRTRFIRRTSTSAEQDAPLNDDIYEQLVEYRSLLREMIGPYKLPSDWVTQREVIGYCNANIAKKIAAQKCLGPPSFDL